MAEVIVKLYIAPEGVVAGREIFRGGKRITEAQFQQYIRTTPSPDIKYVRIPYAKIPTRMRRRAEQILAEYRERMRKLGYEWMEKEKRWLSPQEKAEEVERIIERTEVFPEWMERSIYETALKRLPLSEIRRLHREAILALGAETLHQARLGEPLAMRRVWEWTQKKVGEIPVTPELYIETGFRGMEYAIEEARRKLEREAIKVGIKEPTALGAFFATVIGMPKYLVYEVPKFWMELPKEYRKVIKGFELTQEEILKALRGEPTKLTERQRQELMGILAGVGFFAGLGIVGRGKRVPAIPRAIETEIIGRKGITRISYEVLGRKPVIKEAPIKALGKVEGKQFIGEIELPTRKRPIPEIKQVERFMGVEEAKITEPIPRPKVPKAKRIIKEIKVPKEAEVPIEIIEEKIIKVPAKEVIIKEAKIPKELLPTRPIKPPKGIDLARATIEKEFLKDVTKKITEARPAKVPVIGRIIEKYKFKAPKEERYVARFVIPRRYPISEAEFRQMLEFEFWRPILTRKGEFRTIFGERWEPLGGLAPPERITIARAKGMEVRISPTQARQMMQVPIREVITPARIPLLIPFYRPLREIYALEFFRMPRLITPPIREIRLREREAPLIPLYVPTQIPFPKLIPRQIPFQPLRFAPEIARYPKVAKEMIPMFPRPPPIIREITPPRVRPPIIPPIVKLPKLRFFERVRKRKIEVPRLYRRKKPIIPLADLVSMGIKTAQVGAKVYHPPMMMRPLFKEEIKEMGAFWRFPAFVKRRKRKGGEIL